MELKPNPGQAAATLKTKGEIGGPGRLRDILRLLQCDADHSTHLLQEMKIEAVATGNIRDLRLRKKQIRTVLQISKRIAQRYDGYKK